MKAFFAGLGIGVAIGALVAPKAGSDTRRELGDKLSEMPERGRDLYDQAERKVRRTVREVAQQVNPATRQLLAVINEWPQERLIAIDGIGPVLAGKIIAGRPYDSPEQLIDSKELPPSAIEALRKAG